MSSLPLAIKGESFSAVNNCQDGACMEEVLWVDYVETFTVPNTTMVLELPGRPVQLEKKSVWQSCAPEVPSELTVESFQDCQKAPVDHKDEENLELACNLHKRGLLTTDGQLSDQASLSGKLNAMTTADTLIKDCYAWNVTSEYHVLLDMRDNWEYFQWDLDYYIDYYNYDYDRSSATKSSKKDRILSKEIKNLQKANKNKKKNQAGRKKSGKKANKGGQKRQ